MINIKPVSLQFESCRYNSNQPWNSRLSKSDDAQDHGFLCHLKDVLGGLEGQLPFNFDTYSVKYMHAEIISPDIVENHDILEALHRTTSSITIDMGWSN